MQWFNEPVNTTYNFDCTEWVPAFAGTTWRDNAPPRRTGSPAYAGDDDVWLGEAVRRPMVLTPPAAPHPARHRRRVRDPRTLPGTWRRRTAAPASGSRRRRCAP